MAEYYLNFPTVHGAEPLLRHMFTLALITKALMGLFVVLSD